MSLYGDLVWPEVRERLAEATLVLPVGAIEQHGPHLPLTVDLELAEAIARELGSRLSGLVAPAIAYGARSLPQSGGGSAFPGTIHTTGATLVSYYAEILASYGRAGVRDLVVVNGHYENEPFLFEAIEVCRDSGGFDRVNVVAVSWWSVVSADILDTLFSGEFPGWHAEHAGLCETSLMLYVRPEAVRSERPEHDAPPRDGVYIAPLDAGAISDRGVLASAARASRDSGALLFEHVCAELESLVRSTQRPRLSDERQRSVFVGGPIVHALGDGEFAPGLRRLISELADAFERSGWEVLSAHRVEGFGDRSASFTSEEIVTRDFDWMNRCDVFVPVLPADAGTALRTDGTHVELGWALALGKPVVAVMPSPLPAGYGHMLRGLKTFPRVASVDLAAAEARPEAVVEAATRSTAST